MLLALIAPLVLLGTLGVCATRPQWIAQLTQAGTQEAGTQEDSAKAEESTGRLGQPAAADAEMKYDGGGLAHFGQYSIKIYNPVTSTTFRTDFALEGETTCSDPQVFQQWVANHHCLFREQVAVTLRDGEIAEFMDPKLTLLGRKLVAQVNRMLGEPFLRSVRFKGFRLYESVQDSEFVLWEEANDQRSEP